MSPAKRVALALSHAAATLAIGCGHHASGPTITVSTSAGAHPAAGAFVVTYDATTGEAIDQASTDGDGSASLTSADGALVPDSDVSENGKPSAYCAQPSATIGDAVSVTGTSVVVVSHEVGANVALPLSSASLPAV